MTFDIQTILLSAAIGYIAFDHFQLKKFIFKKTVKIPDDEVFYQLPNTKLPNFAEDVDPKYKTLKDVLLTAELEGWEPKVEIQRGLDQSYHITVWNSSNTIRFFTILRIREKQPYLAFFNISYVDPKGVGVGRFLTDDSKSVSYSNDDKVAKFLIMTYLLKLVTEYHQGEYDKELDRLKSFKELISGELVLLNRDEKLKEVLN